MLSGCRTLEAGATVADCLVVDASPPPAAIRSSCWWTRPTRASRSAPRPNASGSGSPAPAASSSTPYR
ncbi:hypothetical protein ACFQ60_09785 [Streptomyces zhihengii]